MFSKFKEKANQAKTKSGELFNQAKEKSQEKFHEVKEKYDENQARKSNNNLSQRKKSEDHLFTKKNSLNPNQSLFGASLAEATTLSHLPFSDPYNIPAIVWRCIEYIEKKGLDEVGVYRLSGSTVTINIIRSGFQNFDDFNLFQLDEDVHAVCCVLKGYLRELPETVLTKQLSPRFLSIFCNNQPAETLEDSPKSPDESNFFSQEVISEVQKICQLLPDPNYHLLAFLSQHLEKIALRKNINKMSITNLQVIFSPTLGISSHLLHVFVYHWRQVLPLPREKQITTNTRKYNNQINPITDSPNENIISNSSSDGTVAIWEKIKESDLDNNRDKVFENSNINEKISVVTKVEKTPPEIPMFKENSPLFIPVIRSPEGAQPRY
ncbi:hypothetical protein HK099_003846 [Clydaea vesicula]|uniref:Rho-GAP domain-containing protein n=1 Tax=Clydaea vesicula TaxID=447962 RepID=A0AAD5Y0M6_9FUNG|nr:hypothetical protein HK099_003846 [Clydaea vesicula]KAJ3383047.1 hypothetical protein HDU92_004424 [Lobulomyces angularis]